MPLPIPDPQAIVTVATPAVHYTVSIETAAISCLVSMVIGFFANLLAMRKMFAPMSALTAAQTTLQLEIANVSAALQNEVLAREADISDVTNGIASLESDLGAGLEKLESRILSHCSSQLKAQEPILTNIERIWEELKSQSGLILQIHGTTQRLVGELRRRKGMDDE